MTSLFGSRSLPRVRTFVQSERVRIRLPTPQSASRFHPQWTEQGTESSGSVTCAHFYRGSVKARSVTDSVCSCLLTVADIMLRQSITTSIKGALTRLAPHPLPSRLPYSTQRPSKDIQTRSNMPEAQVEKKRYDPLPFRRCDKKLNGPEKGTS